MNTEFSTTQQRTVTAFFDSRSHADQAIERLVQAGIPRTAINLVPGADTTNRTSATSSNASGQDLGFWDSLRDLFLPDDDRAAYAEGLRRGGYVLTLRTDGAHYERALDILDDEGTVNLDERTEAWRSEGWNTSAQDRTAGLGGTAATGLGLSQATNTGAAARTGAGLGATGAASAARGATDTLTEGREEVIPVMEEQLRVGKREVSHGRVRVRSYVVETPVQEQVGLREERVTLERRPVDRAASGTEGLFTDRVIEAEETAEQAVIAKEARVKEELVLRKEAQERTETVSDTVRRTEVEVTDERGNVTNTGTGTGERKLG